MTRWARCRGAVIGMAAVLGLATGVGPGCQSAGENCELLAACGQASATSGGGGQGGQPSCAPGAAPSDGGCVDEAHGIFVRAGADDDNPGTRDAPVGTFERASELARAEGKAVFACSETFGDRRQRIPAGVTIYGGLGCDDWSWAPDQRTVITRVGSSMKALAGDEGGGGAGDGLVPLLLLPAELGDALATIVDFEIRAPDVDTPGSSSVAIVAHQAAAHFVRCVIAAGDAAEGIAGDDAESAPAPGGAQGNPGQGGQCNNTNHTNFGGATKQNPSCTTSVGAKGGNFTVTGAGQGTPYGGQNASPMLTTSGRGAPAEPTTGSWTCPNQNGIGGHAGGHGVGATADGGLTVDGFVGAAGEDGEPGGVGQGGGGGGARRTPPGCPTSHNSAPSGGGGGTGGCGGDFGRGGGAGGSSIAIVSLESKLSFDATELRTKSGGRGGAGGAGQPGGAGGPGGAAGDSSNTCARGGDGGDGGDGGAGGGGRGGHSVAIAFAGQAPDTQGATIVTGSNGLGGSGGPGAPSTSNGAPGLVQAVLDLSN